MFSRSQDLNLDGYELVFYDEFNGDILDTSVWEYRKEGPVKNKDGINHPNQVSAENGNLVITGEYTQTEYGVGWHAASVRLHLRIL